MVYYAKDDRGKGYVVKRHIYCSTVEERRKACNEDTCDIDYLQWLCKRFREELKKAGMPCDFETVNSYNAMVRVGGELMPCVVEEMIDMEQFTWTKWNVNDGKVIECSTTGDFPNAFSHWTYQVTKGK